MKIKSLHDSLRINKYIDGISISSTLPYYLNYSWNRRCQRCTIGLKSDECGGDLNTVIIVTFKKPV